MQQILDVLCIIESSRMARVFGGLLSISWLSRIDTLPYAEFSEFRKRNLKFSYSLTSGDEVFGLAGYSLLLDFTHRGRVGIQLRL